MLSYQHYSVWGLEGVFLGDRFEDGVGITTNILRLNYVILFDKALLIQI
jgi:hypothetical protein